MPVPGWTSDFDWAGFVPFDELPRIYNPPSGIIVTPTHAGVLTTTVTSSPAIGASLNRQLRANQLLREV